MASRPRQSRPNHAGYWQAVLDYAAAIQDPTQRVLNWGNAWQIKALKPLLGPLKLKIDIGFEIDNIWVESNDEQSWYPIPGYDLRAPVVWYVLPSL